MNRVFHSLGVAAGAVVLAFSLSAAAQTDNFMSECQQGSSAADPAKACTCMSDKVTGAVRVDAIAAMHSMNTIKGTNGGGPDPKTLPANQQKGLEAWSPPTGSAANAPLLRRRRGWKPMLASPHGQQRRRRTFHR